MGDVAVEIMLPGQVETDVLGVPVARGEDGVLSNGTRFLDERLSGRLRRLVEDDDDLGFTLRTEPSELLDLPDERLFRLWRNTCTRTSTRTTASSSTR